jgi:ribonuclease P protein component
LGTLKNFRFPTQGSYRTVAAKGERFSFPLLNLKVMQASDGSSRFCFVIKKKNGNAVFRNRCRRILRNIFFKEAKSFQNPLWIMAIAEMKESEANWKAFREHAERAAGQIRLCKKAENFLSC